MEFVEVMGIAKRYFHANLTEKNGVGFAEWFKTSFNKGCGWASKAEWQVAQDQLVAWDKAHPARPALTDEQREVLVWLLRFDFGYVAEDMDGDVWAYKYEPELDKKQWGLVDGDDPCLFAEKLKCLRPLIPDWKTALEIAATLREAGVGV